MDDRGMDIFFSRIFAGLVWRSHGLQYGTGLEGREKHLGIARLRFVLWV